MAQRCTENHHYCIRCHRCRHDVAPPPAPTRPFAALCASCDERRSQRLSRAVHHCFERYWHRGGRLPPSARLININESVERAGGPLAHLVPACWWCGRLRPPCRRPTQIQAYRGPRARALCRTRRRRRFTPVPGRSRRAIRGYPRTAPTRRPRDAESGQILAILHRVPTFFGDYPRRVTVISTL